MGILYIDIPKTNFPQKKFLHSEIPQPNFLQLVIPHKSFYKHPSEGTFCTPTSRILIPRTRIYCTLIIHLASHKQRSAHCLPAEIQTAQLCLSHKHHKHRYLMSENVATRHSEHGLSKTKGPAHGHLPHRRLQRDNQ